MAGSSKPARLRRELCESDRRPGHLPRRIDLCGLPLTVGLTVRDAVELAFRATRDQLPVITTFINPHAFHIAEQRKDYAASLAEFTYVLPDGIGITWGLWLLYGQVTERISFDNTSLALPVLERASRENRTVMLIGARPGVAARAAELLTDAVDGLHITAALDGFKTFEQYQSIILSKQPDIIVCGMGAPLQEEFITRLVRSSGWKGLGYTCGGYFDQLEHGLNYYPTLVDQLNLRWLYRAIREPRRLWRRYAIEYQQFLGALAHEAWRR